jgi:hypothetical protein
LLSTLGARTREFRWATAAGDCMRRARYAGLSWALHEELSDEALERLLYA